LLCVCSVSQTFSFVVSSGKRAKGYGVGAVESLLFERNKVTQAEMEKRNMSRCEERSAQKFDSPKKKSLSLGLFRASFVGQVLQAWPSQKALFFVIVAYFEPVAGKSLRLNTFCSCHLPSLFTFGRPPKRHYGRSFSADICSLSIFRTFQMQHRVFG
jgi:hypothetical protein